MRDTAATPLLFANRAYQIHRTELKNVGARAPGQKAADMLDLDRPNLDWIALARATNLEELARELRDAFATRGPYLVEVAMSWAAPAPFV